MTDDALRRAAVVHNTLMVVNRFFSHQGDGEPDLAGRLAQVRYPGPGAAENIGWGAGASGTADGMVTAWMNSQHHRENILYPQNREIGIALMAAAPIDASAPGTTYTTDFATAIPDPSTAAGASTGAAKPVTTATGDPAAAGSGGTAAAPLSALPCCRPPSGPPPPPRPPRVSAAPGPRSASARRRPAG